MKGFLFVFIFILTGSFVIAGNNSKMNSEKTLNYIAKNNSLANFSVINPLDTVYFDLADAVFSGPYVDIPVYIIAYDSIHSLDFSLKYNHIDLKYDSVILNVSYLSGVSFSENPLDSIVRFTSYSPIMLYDNYIPIVHIRFKMISSHFSSTDFYSLVAYLNGERVGTRLLDGVMWLSSSHHNPSCQTQSDGNINLTVYGGSPPFTYLWSTGDTTSSIQNLVAGTYYVTVTDQIGYVRTDSITLTNPSLFFQVVNPTCSTFNNGSISVSVLGGSAPYHYTWSNLDTTKNIQFLPAGSYSVTVTDSSGCILNGTQIIVDSLILNFANNINIPLCPGSQNGNITINVTGGQSPYSYIWSNSATTNAIDSLASGIYVVTVTDHNGCKNTESINLPDPPAILTLLNPFDLSCKNINDGGINLFVSGGSPPYYYLWSNAETTQNIDSLSPGNYYVTVTDMHGCKTKDSATVINSPEMILNFSTSDISCYNLNNGQITLSVVNGTPPFIYSWSNGDTTQTIYNLSPGIYTVTVSETNHCKKTDSVKVYGASEINIAFQKTDPSCPSSNDGLIEAFVYGGKPPYLYEWSNFGHNDTINNLNNGLYTITVTDANNCLSVNSVKLEPTGDNCLEIYSAFTPNGDGVNDVWNIKGIEYYPECTVNIFNQWGENIFSSVGYKKPWDGTYKDKALPSAVYYYLIELGNGEKYSGSVFLLK